MKDFVKKHHLGQNFLTNRGVIASSIAKAALTVDDIVLEIGPGQRALTDALLDTPIKHLHLVEFDRTLAPWLEPLESDRVSLHWADAVAFDYRHLSPQPTAVVANIPYHITTPLIWRLLAHMAPLQLNRLVLLVQKEAADRLSAPPRTKTRYPLGVTIGCCGKAQTFMKVSPGSFSPPPKVDSALVSITLTERPQLASDPLWRSLLSHAFASRRKTLIKSATSGGWDKQLLLDALSHLQLPLTSRAEELSNEQWLQLYTWLQPHEELAPPPLHKLEED